jgi:hypothetical protein
MQKSRRRSQKAAFKEKWVVKIRLRITKAEREQSRRDKDALLKQRAENRLLYRTKSGNKREGKSQEITL